MRSGYDVQCDRQIVADEVCRIAAVGVNTADPRSRQKDGVGFACVEPAPRLPGLGQIEIGTISAQYLTVFATKSAHKGGPHHAAMTRHVDAFALESERDGR